MNWNLFNQKYMTESTPEDEHAKRLFSIQLFEAEKGLVKYAKQVLDLEMLLQSTLDSHAQYGHLPDRVLDEIRKALSHRKQTSCG